ncbi:BT1926 family outer membrane beta-barrel protein [Phocaeicola coprophilus]|uniref:BT1926 family outer membrane beta-barrel protein n=1 Tax=Phocaeicola coprophilus TaxID=387090 RepID=UPI002671457C|nr:BT1926 family outer membrane beta-barrel protein [Phocaeicola coprophilus]
MIKKLCILLLSVASVAPITAQQYSSSDASFAPKKGQWQVSAVIGNNQMFDQSMNYLLPNYWSPTNQYPQVGLGGYGQQSSDPGVYLNLGNLNSNSLVNLIGIQGKYFLTDRWDVNLMFSMNINATPKKDYIDGDYTIENMPIMASKYMEGRISNAWNVAVGSNYYFNTKNERINLYVGGLLGWQMGRIETTTPYTGETFTEDEELIQIDDPSHPDYNSPYNEYGPNYDPDLVTESVQLYTPNSRAGQIFGLKVAGVAGIEYSLSPGLILGFEVQPVAYRYDHIQICPKGQAAYKVGHHNINFFATPNLKIGFRF